MRYLISLLLVASLQTTSASPQTTENNPIPPRQKITKKANNNAAPNTTPPLPPVNDRTTDTAVNNAARLENTPQSVKVQELPPVKVLEFPRLSIVKDWTNDLAAWLFSALLVFVGYLQVRVLKAQAQLMKKHAEHLKNVAEAAKDAAGAERAWLQAVPNMPNFNLQSFGNPDAVAMFNWFVTNAGRTPARVLEIAARYRLIVNLNTIPAVPEYDGDLEKIPFYGRLLIPDEQITSSQPLEPSVLSHDDLAAIWHGQRTLFAYGYVNYLDIFGNSHQTAFSYYYYVPQGGMVAYAGPGWRPFIQAPAEYNKVT